MTPKEKAQELVDKYVSLTDGWVYGIASWEYKKKCALVTVDVVLSTIVSTPTDYGASWTYWMQVKQEIEKL
jgi:inorganic pyrophosphatase